MWLGLVGWIKSGRGGSSRELGCPKQEVPVHRDLWKICALSGVLILERVHDPCFRVWCLRYCTSSVGKGFEVF